MKTSMLTTIDNPFNPFDDWDSWYVWDDRAGYATPGLLARIAMVSNELSEADQAAAIEHAINEIVSENVSGVHKKVTKDLVLDD